ncbi:MAG: C10 family peptidase [Muribaculaceae bacterium]|nr:C10 family peptidase [Muribaculaceae bacterium]
MKHSTHYAERHTIRQSALTAGAVLICSLISMPSFAAGTLTPEQALSRALGSSTARKAKINGQGPRFSLKHTVSPTDGEPGVYVFQNSAGGYLISSARSCGAPVLGYADSGSFELNPTTEWWLASYAAQMQNASSDDSYTAVSDELAPIEAMTVTEWGQGTPYNSLTPVISGTHAVTGCVATALAQVMYYHRWPAKGNGSHSYTLKATGESVSADFSNSTYDWSEMLPSYSSDSPESARNAVAELMYDCGVATNMQYTTGESSAQAVAIPNAMVEYFGYDKGLYYADRNYYDIEEWNRFVYDQLANYGPVQYSGQSDDGGHSFVCDGYSHDGYFHINWGWTGSANGYFLLTALSPTEQGEGSAGEGYNFEQSIIADVQPPVEGSEIKPVFYLAGNLTPSVTSVGTGRSLTLYGPLYNYSYEPMSVRTGLRITAADGTVTYASGQQLSSLPMQVGVMTFSVTMPSDLASGNYTATPVVQYAGKWYDVRVLTGKTDRLMLHVSGSDISFSGEQGAILTASGLTAGSEFHIGSGYELNATVSNIGAEDYTGTVCAVFTKNQGATRVALGEPYPLYLTPGETQPLKYYSEFTHIYASADFTPGTYTVYLADSYDMQPVSEGIVINIEGAGGTPEFSLSDVALDVADTAEVNPDEIKVSGVLNCSSGYFADRLRAVITPTEGTITGRDSGSFYSEPVFASAGESTDFTIEFSFQNARPGQEYSMVLYQGNTPKSEPVIFRTASDIVTALDESRVDDSDEYITGVYTVTGVSLPVPQTGISHATQELRNLYSAGYYVLHTSTGRSLKVKI